MTLIDIYTDSSFRYKALLAETLIVDTFSVIRAVEIRFAKDIYINLENVKTVGGNVAMVNESVVTCSHATVGDGLAWYP